MTLANPGTNEPFSTATVNANFEALDTDAGATDASLTANASSITSVGNRVTTIEAGAGRGNLARETTTNPTTLSAIADALVGDRVFVITPATGISGFWAECIGTPGSNAADWAPQDTIVAATKANLDAFIIAWLADTDLSFKVGALAYVTGTRMMYRFTTQAGAYVFNSDSQLPVSAPTLTATTGTIAQDTTSGVINLTTCTGTIDFAQVFNDTTAKDFDVEFDLTGSTAQSITMAMLDASNTLATAKHATIASVVGGSATVSSGTVPAAANWGLSFSSTGVKHRWSVKFKDVNVASETYVRVEGSSYTNPVASGANNTHGTKGLIHEDATIMRGFRLVVSAGNVSGTVTVKARTR